MWWARAGRRWSRQARGQVSFPPFEFQFDAFSIKVCWQQGCPLSGRRGWSWLGLRWRGGSCLQLLSSTLGGWKPFLPLCRLDTRSSPIAKGEPLGGCLFEAIESHDHMHGNRRILLVQTRKQQTHSTCNRRASASTYHDTYTLVHGLVKTVKECQWVLVRSSVRLICSFQPTVAFGFAAHGKE